MLNEDNNVSLLDLVRIKILKDKAFSMHTNIRKERSRDSYRLCRFFSGNVKWELKRTINL